MTVRLCPTCRKPVPWEGNPFKPFCSERCKTQDLGAWSSEAFRIPVSSAEDPDDSWSEGPVNP